MKISLDNYKKFIDNLIVDKEIKEEIINKIIYFNRTGKIKLDGYNLFGKITKERNNDYLEIRYENGFLICNYTMWNFGRYVNITQKCLENGYIKINKKTKDDEEWYDKENEIQIEEIEKIYNADKKLVYESLFRKEDEYELKNNSFVYSDESPFKNYFSLDRKWYIDNGSIINYYLSNNSMNKDAFLIERYMICPEVSYDEFGNTYNYLDLDKDLFKSFMTGNITIEEVLEKTNLEEEVKKLMKTNNDEK